jgi:hypothetical protein
MLRDDGRVKVGVGECRMGRRWRFWCGVILTLVAGGGSAIAKDVVLFPYFLGNGEAGVYLCYSSDGRKFEKLNDGKPIFTPPNWRDGQVLTRDPSIVFHDGTFHMVWTTNWTGRVFGYATSPDLVTWSKPVMVTPFSSELPADEQPENVWAPELRYDPMAKDFQIVFASTIPREKNDGDGSEDRHKYDHRLYVVRTRDFKSFSEPAVVFDHDYSVIDGFTATDGDRLAMAIKREQDRPVGKNLRLMFADAAGGDWSEAGEPILGPGSPIRSNDQVEGPTLFKFGSQWLLCADAFSSGRYVLIVSPDLETWTDETETLSFPVKHPRHGTFFVVGAERVGWLQP